MILRQVRRQRLVRPGFTLMEMMVVVAIIVALAGIGIFILAPQADEGTKTKIKADIKSLTAACLAYKLQHGGQYPPSLDVLAGRDESGNGPYVKAEDLIVPNSNPPQMYSYDPSGQNNQGAGPDISCQTQWGVFCNWTSKILH
ncbi:MAG: prepilin-type N-terminal cleavage/methylation domain-containing protein [Planctomycetes bacterium]|nr:prepilin-type N-terminal cleavage/methylation domain-containing protein [Planctomycetota bacterium]